MFVFTPPRMRLAAGLLALAALALLTGCIDSTAPILTDSQQLLGGRPRLQFYGLHHGGAYEPTSATFRWRDGRYVYTGGTFKDVGAFTLHAFEGADLIVQSINAGKPVEYALARKMADATYLVFPIDENDADEATRAKLCSKDAQAACRISTREQLLAFARATAAKPHTIGGLALLLADR
jgi:hypothetical protein